MKEKEKIDEIGEILIEGINEVEEPKIKKEIDLNIYNYQTKNLENYKLLNESENIILCKEDKHKEIQSIKENKEGELKIKELYNKQEGDSFYYLNKKEIKKNFLQNAIDIEKEYENSIIDNKNGKEMEKLYNEAQLKHPRLIIDGKIRRYPFFSFSGFFCCNKSDHFPLGQLYLTYFNTIKLLIIFFLLISLIQIFAINCYKQYTTVYNFDNDGLLKTTLGNTITNYFNTTIIELSYGTNYDFNLSLDCGEDIVQDIIAIRRFFNVRNEFAEKLKPGIISNELYNKREDETSDSESLSHPFSIPYNGLSAYLNIIKPLYTNNGYYGYILENNSCILKLNYKSYQSLNNYIILWDYDETATDVVIYSCLKKNNFIHYGENQECDYQLWDEVKIKRNYLFNLISLTSLFTLILIIIFYYFYKKSISKDKEEYQKNKIFINDYTLVLKNLKIIADDYEQELSDLISFLNEIIKTHKNLFLSYRENYKEITDLNIFDISISNVNEKKLKLLKK